MGTPYKWPVVVEPGDIQVATTVTALGRLVLTDLTTGVVTVVSEGQPEPPPPPPPTPWSDGNPMGIIAQYSAMTGDVSTLMAPGDTAEWTVATTDGTSRGNSSAVAQVLTGPNMSITYNKPDLDVSCTIRTSAGAVKQQLGPQRIPQAAEKLIDLTTYGMHGETVRLWAEVIPRTATADIAVALVQTHGDALSPTHYRTWTGSEPGAEVGWIAAGSWPGTITSTAANQKWNVQARFTGPASDADSVVRTYVWRYTFPTVVWSSRPVGLALRSQAAFASRYPPVGTFTPLPSCRADRYPNWRVDSAPASELAAAGDWTDGAVVSVDSAAILAKYRTDMLASYPYGGFFLNTPAAYTFSYNWTKPGDPPVNIQYAGFRSRPDWRGDNGVGVPLDIDSAISSAGTDGHGVFYDSSTDRLHEVWKMQVRHGDDGQVGIFSETGANEPNQTTQGDFVFDTGSVAASGCVSTVANISLAEVQEVQRRAKWNTANPGGPRWSMRGAIPHMVAYAAPLQSVTWRRRSWPAKANDGWGNANTADMLMEGQRSRLDPTENPDTYTTAGPFGQAIAWAARDYGMFCTDMAGAFVVSIEDTRGYTSAWGVDAWALVTEGIGNLSLTTGLPWTTKLQFLKRHWGQDGSPIGRAGTDPAGWTGMGGPAASGYGTALYGTGTYS